jgi:glycosyltransferase involved in cell wall biosynthesis
VDIHHKTFKMTKLGVLIPTFRRPTHLTTLLWSLSDQIRTPDQVIIVFRGDDDLTILAINEWLKNSPLASLSTLVTISETGHLPPLIAGLKVCSTDVVCLIDDDAVPTTDWLKHIKEDFDDPLIGGIGGKVINHIKGNPEPFVITPGKLSWFGRSGHYGKSQGLSGNLFEIDCPNGGNMAYRKEAMLKSIDMVLNGGSAISYETDIALNVKKTGLKVLYDPRVVIDHYPAPRHIDAKRGWNAEECFIYAHNLTYICMRHLRWYGKLGFLIYFFVGGSWGCPGLVTYFLGLCFGRKLSWSRHFLPSMKGRWEGIRSFSKKLAIEKVHLNEI